MTNFFSRLRIFFCCSERRYLASALDSRMMHPWGGRRVQSRKRPAHGALDQRAKIEQETRRPALFSVSTISPETTWPAYPAIISAMAWCSDNADALIA